MAVSFIIASSSSQSRERRVRLISGLQRCFKIHHPVLPFRPADHATNNDEDDVGGGDGDVDDGGSGGGNITFDRCMSQLLLLGKFEYGGGPIFKVVLEC